MFILSVGYFTLVDFEQIISVKVHSIFSYDSALGHSLIDKRVSYMMMIMMTMNCFCGKVDRREAFSLISNRGHSQRSSPSQISDTLRAGFEPVEHLS